MLENEKNRRGATGFQLALTVGASVIAMWLWFAWLGGRRNVDGDEGLYLEAARLAMSGKFLYSDFFFQQMPLTPYLYGFWMKCFGFTILAARHFSAFLTAGAGAFMLAYVARTTRSLFWVNAAGLLFFANGLILAWAPVVKTHPLTMFALVGSAVSILEWRRSRSLAWLVLAGILIGFGIGGRLTLGPLAVFYFLYVAWDAPSRRLSSLAVLLLSVLLVSIPVFYFFARDPALFWKYNLTYHTEVYPGVVSAARRWNTAQMLLQQVQVFLLCVASQVTVLIGWYRDGRRFFKSDNAFWALLLGVFIAIHMASAEPYTQYFSAAMPILILLALPALQWMAGSGRRILPVLALALFALIYLGGARSAMDFEIASMLSNRPEWALGNIQRVVWQARKALKPDEECLTWWPGYAFLAKCRSVAGMENHMRNYAVQRKLPETVQEYRMLTDEELLQSIRQRKYRVVIDGVYHIESPYYHEIQRALREGYWDVGYGVKVRSPAWFRVLLDNN